MDRANVCYHLTDPVIMRSMVPSTGDWENSKARRCHVHKVPVRPYMNGIEILCPQRQMNDAKCVLVQRIPPLRRVGRLQRGGSVPRLFAGSTLFSNNDVHYETDLKWLKQTISAAGCIRGSKSRIVCHDPRYSTKNTTATCGLAFLG